MSVWSGAEDNYERWTKLNKIEFKNKRSLQTVKTELNGRVANKKTKTSGESVQVLMQWIPLRRLNSQPTQEFHRRI